MDNSSRNIVKFIGAITFAALLIMAARYYAQSQEEPMPAVAEEAPPTKASPSEIVQEPLPELATDDPENPQNPDGTIIEEDAEIIMGEPSMNLEQGGTPVYTPPPAETEPPVEQSSGRE